MSYERALLPVPCNEISSGTEYCSEKCIYLSLRVHNLRYPIILQKITKELCFFFFFFIFLVLSVQKQNQAEVLEYYFCLLEHVHLALVSARVCTKRERFFVKEDRGG
jgi:hypothetical protein